MINVAGCSEDNCFHLKYFLCLSRFFISKKLHNVHYAYHENSESRRIGKTCTVEKKSHQQNSEDSTKNTSDDKNMKFVDGIIFFRNIV